MQLADAIHLTIRMTQLLGTKPVGLVAFLPGAFDQPKVITKEASSTIEETLEEKEAEPRKHTWTLTHGFYACMGGFRITSLENDSTYFPTGYQSLSLDPDGLILMAKKAPHLVPDISKDNIMEKSKDSGLLLAIIIVQVAWFCFQVISRLATRQSLSLIEINTFAHLICTLLLPFIWWSKPRNIQSSHILSSETHEQKCFNAAAIMSSTIGMFKECNSKSSKSKIYGLFLPTFLSAFKDGASVDERSESPSETVGEESRYEVCLESLKIHGPVDAIAAVDGTEPSLAGDIVDQSASQIVQEDALPSSDPTTLHSGDKSLEFYFQEIYTRDFWDYNLVKTLISEASAMTNHGEDVEAQNSKSQDSPAIRLSPADRRLFQLAKEGFELYKLKSPLGIHWALSESPVPKFSRSLAPMEQAPDFKHVASYLTSKVENWPKRWGTGSFHALLIFLFVELIYAAIHFLAWNGPFKTRNELLLWRIAVITFAVPALAWVALVVAGIAIGVFVMFGFFGFMGFMFLTEKRFKEFWNALERIWTRFGVALERTTQLLLIGWLLFTALICLAYVLLYVLAKTFIIVECLIQLAFIPDLALVQPSWTLYIPHFS
jgi:hypothetical protein